MSEAQLHKLQLEKQLLEADLTALKQADDPQITAKTILEEIGGSSDPFETPDNPWTKPAAHTGCCNVM
jgi:hypothetical protein